MDPNSLISRVMAQIGQQQAPLGYPGQAPNGSGPFAGAAAGTSMAPIAETINSYGRRDPRDVNWYGTQGVMDVNPHQYATGWPGRVPDGGQMGFSNAQAQTAMLQRYVAEFGPPPPGVVSGEQMLRYYNGLISRQVQQLVGPR